MDFTKMAVFWVVAPCCLSIIRAIALMMEATRTSETLVNFYQTIRRYNPEDSQIGDDDSSKTPPSQQLKHRICIV
jgi:hypothetical protein